TAARLLPMSFWPVARLLMRAARTLPPRLYTTSAVPIFGVSVTDASTSVRLKRRPERDPRGHVQLRTRAPVHRDSPKSRVRSAKEGKLEIYFCPKRGKFAKKTRQVGKPGKQRQPEWRRGGVVRGEGQKLRGLRPSGAGIKKHGLKKNRLSNHRV